MSRYINQTVYSHIPYQFGKSIMGAFVDELNRIEPPEIKSPLPKLDFSLETSEKRNDGKPKRVRQPVPSYVRMTEKKRR